ncbi:hypothetical protein ACODGR_13195 [Vagococcus fluvialis]|uniref:hypothetical protein n=1 Tax=Vagococcus fluvialis TaxID=2738 RepID=UPI0028913B85|nr:hypothetical protein [Vagococcus fluvialis]MDT2783012.1 hypothetical protein [Vagococcus fluvialis]WNF91680.1 hypothetical protein QDW48_14455 [Vagococcus fluvialis]
MTKNLKKMISDGFSGLGWIIWFLVCFSLVTKNNILGLESYINIIIALYPLASVLIGYLFSFVNKSDEK